MALNGLLCAVKSIHTQDNVITHLKLTRLLLL